MTGTDLRSTLGRVGLWSMELRGAGRPGVRDIVAELDDLGWRTVWLPGLDGGPAVFDDAEILFSAAPDISVVTAVLQIWGQSADTLARRIDELDAAWGARLVAGLGVSSPESAAGKGQQYGNPLTSMSRYLDGLNIPAQRTLLGALGPRMVDLASSRTGGWHPFLVTPDYVAKERARVGAGPVIAPHQAVVLGADADQARTAGRTLIGMMVGMPTYRANLRRLGFTDDDFTGGGSDRMVDALVAYGTLDDVVRRVRDHHDAGADHVALHVLADPREGLPARQWRELSSALTALRS